MTEHPSPEGRPADADADDLPDLELSDNDIIDAMREIDGYLDISTGDFRTIYHLAHRHALERMFKKVAAHKLMRSDFSPLRPETTLDVAARALVAQDYKALPVVDADQSVIGILTETDFLRRLESDSFLQLLLRIVEEPGAFAHRCHETPVREAMSVPVVTVAANAGFQAIVKAFHAHDGRSMPVVDADGRLQGLLLRKDFVRACHLEDLL